MSTSSEALGKNTFRDFIEQMGISYEENTNNDLGEHDFEIIVGGFMDESISLTVDVRCRREPWDVYVFEDVEHYNDDGADIYVFSDAVSEQVPKLIGWLKNEDFEQSAIIEGNYAFEDSQLRSMDTFTDYMYEVSQW